MDKKDEKKECKCCGGSCECGKDCKCKCEC
jgi:hypothetical protein